jgi:hypothetical protein
VGQEDALALDAQDPPRAAGPPVPEPPPFGPEDAVPRFRTDLQVRRGATPALFDVSDPVTERKFTLYEFELAIARMLDGRRKVSEVVESGARLGIPMDVGALYKFVRQMWHYGFLAPPGEAGRGDALGEAGTWDTRQPWDEATRTLFQTGQRLMRLGRNADAAGYFEAVLDAHPANPEATEMLALIARGGSLAAVPLGETRPQDVPAAPREAPRRRRSMALLLVAVAVAVVALGAIALLVPPGAPERAVAPPAAPAPVVVAPAPPPPPAPAAPASPAWRTAPVERRTHPPLAELVAPADGDLAWTAAADARVAKGQKVGAVRVALGAGRKDAALAKRVAELEKLAAQDPVYRDFLEKARRDLRRTAARRKTRAVPLVAPVAGILARAPEAAGSAAAGERVARVLDPAAWQFAAAVDGPEPGPDAACEVVGDVATERAACRLLSRVRAGERTEVLAEVTAADAPWIARAASLWLRIAGASPPLPGAAPAAPAEREGERRTP